MKWAIALLLLISGCGGKTAPTASPSGDAPEKTLEVPGGCTLSASGVPRDFRRWGTLTADEYTCAWYPRMSCIYAETDTKSEIVCKGTVPTNPQGPISGCSNFNSGAHTFPGVGSLFVNAYQCPNQINDLYCFYYFHNYGGGTYEEEMICVDHDYF